MFCQPFEPKEIENNLKPNNLPSKSKLKAKRKQQKKLVKKALKKNHSKFASTMSNWAENFTVAATWQFKHQISYWKARAKALEYENAVLHDVIRRNHCKLDLELSSGPSHTRTDSVEPQSDVYSDTEIDEEGEFEVSEEFINFLAANAKFKEEAKRERERLRAKQDEENVISMEEKPRETVEENNERLNELYGDKWQRISALETNMLSKFISDCDKNKPVFWPNIPFNFNYS